jgi:hypothetical protein
MRNSYSKNKHCKCGKLITNNSKRCKKCWIKKLHKLLHKIGYPAFIDGRKKDNHYCIKCKRKIHYNLWRKSKICGKCRPKITGKKHHNYKHGKTCKNKKYYCIDCGKKISIGSAVYKNKRCRKCANLKELNPSWIDGRSYKPYTSDFDYKLKEFIRKRDNYTCQVCGIKQKNYYRKLDVHHIDYNKKNCNKDNLIALCNRCNCKVNSNRDYWNVYFKHKIKEKNNV